MKSEISSSLLVPPDRVPVIHAAADEECRAPRRRRSTPCLKIPAIPGCSHAPPARSRYIVTGDAVLLRLGTFRGIRTVKVADLLALMQEPP
jgi:hypothetical protein